MAASILLLLVAGAGGCGRSAEMSSGFGMASSGGVDGTLGTSGVGIEAGTDEVSAEEIVSFNVGATGFSAGGVGVASLLMDSSTDGVMSDVLLGVGASGTDGVALTAGSSLDMLSLGVGVAFIDISTLLSPILTSFGAGEEDAGGIDSLLFGGVVGVVLCGSMVFLWQS